MKLHWLRAKPKHVEGIGVTLTIEDVEDLLEQYDSDLYTEASITTFDEGIKIEVKVE